MRSPYQRATYSFLGQLPASPVCGPRDLSYIADIFLLASRDKTLVCGLLFPPARIPYNNQYNGLFASFRPFCVEDILVKPSLAFMAVSEDNPAPVYVEDASNRSNTMRSKFSVFCAERKPFTHIAFQDYFHSPSCHKLLTP